MEDQRRNPNSESEKSSRPTRSPNFWILLFALACILIYAMVDMSTKRASEISYDYFRNLMEGNNFDGDPLKVEGKRVESPIASVTIVGTQALGKFSTIPPVQPTLDKEGLVKEAPKDAKLKRDFVVELGEVDSIRPQLEKEFKAKNIRYSFKNEPNYLSLWTTAMLLLFSFGLLLFLFLSMRRSQNSMMGGGGFLSNFSRSPAKKYEASDRPVTFDDVAGLEGVKADLQEIVDFLKDPTKFQKLGGRVPKGVLLVGPPGTGKTLLARAVAGEADVPYFSVNGSEFIQMFVGVGASRVRDLFATAKSQSPAIVFIDEIDAVGRQRGAGLGGGHDEREQTLNQILGEMDGFDKTDSVIIIAATNRPDILDPALLRPGRFDRHVTVSRPTLKGRLAIFKVHVRDIPLAPDVDLKVMAQATAGMTGADIQNLANEAALWAARKNKNKVEMSDFYYAHDKVLMGAKREEVLSPKEKERTAYHEAGHTIAAWFLDGANPVHKVTVIPRGRALGVTQMVPDEDRMNMSEREIRDHLIVLLAGRAAEQLIYKEYTVGAENDLERATSMARRMITHWGMNERLGPVSYKMMDEDPFLGREMQKSRSFSEHTMEVIDAEVAKVLQQAAKEAYELLEKHRDNLQSITDGLMENEELDRNELEALIGPSVHKKPASMEELDEELDETSDVQDSNQSKSNQSKSDQSKPDELEPSS